jgi:hypothetical protein
VKRRHTPQEIALLKRWEKEWEAFAGKYSKGTRPISRKKHPLACGCTQCFMCHSDKYPKRELTKREMIANEDVKFYKNHDL